MTNKNRENRKLRREAKVRIPDLLAGEDREDRKAAQERERAEHEARRDWLELVYDPDR